MKRVTFQLKRTRILDMSCLKWSKTYGLHVKHTPNTAFGGLYPENYGALDLNAYISWHL